LDSIGEIAEQRSLAEQWAKTLKSDWPEGSKEYADGRAIYIEAKASYDGWIEQLKFDIISGNTPDKTSHRAKLDEAIKKAEDFINYMKALDTASLPVDGTPTPIKAAWKLSVVTVAIEAILDAGLKIWEAYHNAEQQRKQEIINLLDGLKWKSFQDL
jgi:hypothetical protein